MLLVMRGSIVLLAGKYFLLNRFEYESRVLEEAKEADETILQE